MVKQIFKLTGIVLLSVATISCNSKGKKKTTKSTTSQFSKENYNVGILLDLSDRINPRKYKKNIDIYKRDVDVIKIIAEQMVTHLKSKKVRKLNDYIRVFIEPENYLDDKQITLYNELNFSFTRKNTTKSTLNDFQQKYSTYPEEFYKLAIKDSHYVGSDIWSFFKDKIDDFFLKKNHRNILIILTDGYLYHKNNVQIKRNKTSFLTPERIRKQRLNKSDWEERIEKNKYGYLPISKQFDNLEVLVLGIHSHNDNIYEKNVLKKFLSQWFDEMHLKKYKILESTLSQNVNVVIQKFLNPE